MKTYSAHRQSHNTAPLDISTIKITVSTTHHAIFVVKLLTVLPQLCTGVL